MMRFLLYLAWIFLLVAPAAADETVMPATPDDYRLYGSSRALLIATPDYQDPEWNRLGPLADRVEVLKRFLEDRGFVTEVVINPTATELRTRLREFVVTAPPDSQSVIYFGGHGYSDPKDYSKGYIIPTDAPVPSSMLPESAEERQARLQRFRATAFSTEEMRSLARDSQGRHTLFLLDSCFSAALFQTMAPSPARLPRSTRPSVAFWEETGTKTFQFITAGSEKQTVPVTSPFVSLVMEGLEGAADFTESGFVSAKALGLYVKLRMAQQADPAYRELIPQSGVIELRSTLGGQAAGDMIFKVPGEDGPAPGGGTAQVQPISAPLGRLPAGRSGTARLTDAVFRPGAYRLAEPSVPLREMLRPVQAEVPQDEVDAPQDEVDARREMSKGEVDRLRQSVMMKQSEGLGTYNIIERFEGLDVRYYRKARDEQSVFMALNELAVPYVARPAQLNSYKTNALACHPDQYDLDVLKAIGIALIRNGVELKIVKAFSINREIKQNRLEILTVAWADDYPPLTEDDIRSLTGCPEKFSKEVDGDD